MLSTNCIEVLLNINTELEQEPDRLTLARSTSRLGVFTLSNLYQQADLASYKHKHSLSPVSYRPGGESWSHKLIKEMLIIPIFKKGKYIGNYLAILPEMTLTSRFNST